MVSSAAYAAPGKPIEGFGALDALAPLTGHAGSPRHTIRIRTKMVLTLAGIYRSPPTKRRIAWKAW
jgi:hypothetical protein